MISEILIAVVVLLLLYGYIILRKSENYWKNQGIPFISSPFLLGNFWRQLFLIEFVTDALDRMYKHPIAKGQPFVGIHVFNKPALYILDIDLVKRVLVKDFNHFSDRHVHADPTVDPMGGYDLFRGKNPLWRKLRLKLSPVFTSGKMKQMFYLIDQIGKSLHEQLKLKVQQNSMVEVRELTACFTLDSIALTAFATEANCLKQNETSEFKEKVFNCATASKYRKFSFLATFFIPDLGKYLRIKTFTDEFEVFMRKLFSEVMVEREKSGIARQDLIDALIAVKKADQNDDDKIFTDDILLAQAAVFMFAGFETSSGTLGFLSYELAKNQQAQQKLRDEIKEVLEQCEGKLTYDKVISGMPYMTAAIQETLRIYPVLPFLDRVCVSDEGYSLEPYSSFVIPKGMPVYIPFYCYQMDPQYFPDPEVFEPERFLSKENINEYSYMPFGTGPHNCIGERFAMMQMKVALINMLRSFKIERCEQTPKQINFDKENILFRAVGGITVKFVPDDLGVYSR